MKVVWCDTETTGLKPEESGAFQIAMLYKFGADKKKMWERVFYLNPIDEEKGIFYHDEAAKTHGISRETIESYDKPDTVLPKIATFLNEYGRGFDTKNKFEKLTFAGYNCKFDWEHIDALFKRYTDYKMSDFFESRMIDVYAQVKRATDMGKINTVNQKLGTVCKSLNVPLENAHNALGDISATRKLGITLQKMGVPLIM